jgi:DNA repair photolyase
MRWDNLKIEAEEGARLPGYRDPATVRRFDAPEALDMRFYEIQAKSALNRVPEASRMPFRWTINPYRGCSHACVYCLAGDTPILMADGRTRRLSDLRAGDEIYGTEREGSYRRYVRTRVEAHWRTAKPAFRVVLEDGTEVVASGDHRFLTNRGWKHVRRAGPGEATRPYLTETVSLLGPGAFATGPVDTEGYRRGYLCGAIRGDAQETEARGRAATYLRAFGTEGDAAAGAAAGPVVTAVGRRRRAPRSVRGLARSERVDALIAWPFEPGDDWRRGFLAGIFDADGSCGSEALRIDNADPTILSWTERCLTSFGFSCEVVGPDAIGVRAVRVHGGVRAQLRLCHMTGPAVTAKWGLEGRAVKTNAPLGVVAIEPLHGGAPTELYDITTGTGDFVANGVVSHNCFARPTHTYLDFDAGRDFEREIVVKVNVPEVLRAELRRPSWKREHIAMGTNTDPYQWVEGRYQLMPGIWEALRDFRNPCSVLTKSPLLLRDLPLLKQIAEVTDVSANLSIPTIDERAWRATEPHTPHPRARLEAVAELNRNGIPTGILVAPLMPGINDDPKQVEEIIQTAIAAGATSIGGIGLHVRGEVRGVFMEWLRAYRPDLVERYEELYARGAYLQRPERDRLAGLLRRAGAPAARPFRRDPADERPFERAFRRQMGPRGGRGGSGGVGAGRERPGPPAGVQESLF